MLDTTSTLVNYTQTDTNNVNIHEPSTGGKDETNIVFMQKS
jgi:hypothetical protein